MYAYLTNLFQVLEKRLDAIAMYRIVSIALLTLAFCSVVLGFLGLIPYSGTEQVISLAVAVLTAQIVNWLCSLLWRVPVNSESANITALIIFFLIIPAQFSSLGDTWVIATVTFIAIVSKFIFAWHKQHLANPAAVGVLVLAIIYEVFSLPGYFESSWWIGRVELFIPLVIAGVLVVIKIRKWTPVITFLVVAFFVYLIEELRFGSDVLETAPNFWLSGPSLFLAFFMLTEPFTLPPTKKLQMYYGALVGFISQTTLFLPFIKMTPELALIIGNLIFYPSTLKQKLIMPLVEMKEIAKNTFEFAFQKPARVNFVSGQYLEWMLPHQNPDDRGIRRYFTIASAPQDSLLRVAVRFADTVSTYKQTLKSLTVGQNIIASQLAGDFVLPKDNSKKLGFIAGGIGITPFLSHVGQIRDNNLKHDVVLYYGNNTVEEIAYKQYLDEMQSTINLKVVNVIVKEQVPEYESGYLATDMIKKHSPDFIEREWYLSGPPGMVNAYFKLLREMGVPKKNIKRDFFPGLA